MNKTQFNALTIAGSDCSGGAGIQADLKTFQELGCYGMSVITAVTAQNTQGVQSIFPISPTHVEEQIYSIFEDIDVHAVKVGMLFSIEIIESVSRALIKANAKNIVIDPVMIAKSGNPLLNPDATNALKELLFPLATIVTPNIPEAQTLSAVSKCDNDDERIEIAKNIQKFTPSVLIKGGHSEDKDIVKDLLLISNQKAHWISQPRIHTKNTHGTGCTYSAAIAAYLAQNYSLHDAILTARIYLQGAIQYGANKQIGHGCGPVHHAWKRV